MELDRAVKAKLKLLQVRVNAERKKNGLSPLTLPQVVAECIDVICVLPMPCIGSVYIRN